MIEYGKRYYNLDAIKSTNSTSKDIYLTYLSLLNNIWRLSLFIILVLVWLLFFFQSLIDKNYENSLDSIFLLLLFPFGVFIEIIVTRMVLFFYSLTKEGLWLRFKNDFVIIHYIWKQKIISYKELSISVNPYSDTFIYSKKHNYSLLNSTIPMEDWIAFVRQEKIQLCIDYHRYLLDELENVKTKSVWIVKNLEDDNKKIDLEKWTQYLEMNPSIVFINKIQFENYSEAQRKEEEITHYYEWKENESIIAFIEYEENSGTIFIDILKEKFHLVEEMAKELEAEIDG